MDRVFGTKLNPGRLHFAVRNLQNSMFHRKFHRIPIEISDISAVHHVQATDQVLTNLTVRHRCRVAFEPQRTSKNSEKIQNRNGIIKPNFCNLLHVFSKCFWCKTCADLDTFQGDLLVFPFMRDTWDRCSLHGLSTASRFE